MLKLLLATLLITLLALPGRQRWRMLIQDGARQKRILVVSLALTVLWSMQAGLHPLLQFHFLAMTLATLMLGLEGALLAGGLAWVTRALLGLEAPEWGVEWLLAWVALPAALTQFMHLLVQKYLPHNYFIFFFLTGFLTSMLSAMLAMGSWAGLVMLENALQPEQVQREFLYLIPLMLFGEGFINGLHLAIFVVYRPAWVLAFSDRLYLPYRRDL